MSLNYTLKTKSHQCTLNYTENQKSPCIHLASISCPPHVHLHPPGIHVSKFFLYIQFQSHLVSILCPSCIHLVSMSHPPCVLLTSILYSLLPSHVHLMSTLHPSHVHLMFTLHPSHVHLMFTLLSSCNPPHVYVR